MLGGGLTRWLLRLLALACLAAPCDGLQIRSSLQTASPDFPSLLLQEPPSDGLNSAAPHPHHVADEQQSKRLFQKFRSTVRYVLMGDESTTSVHPGSLNFYFTVLGSLGLCLFAGLMSGLTIGLMSFDVVDLTVIERTGKGNEPQQAQQVKTLVQDQHLLLVTLLICNAAAMEALPIMLDMLVSPGVAILLSVTGVLFFGEILPQALCKAFGLRIGSASAPIVWVLIAICYPVARPIALLLDWLLGHEHGRLFTGPQMAAVLEIHKEQGQLTQNEFQVMDGALALAQKTCRCCMTRAGQVQTLPQDAVLDEKTMDWMLETGYSRIPVCDDREGGRLLGALLTKKLIKLRPEDATPVRALNLNPVHHVSEDTLLYDLLRTFQQGKSHMAAVYGREYADQLLEGRGDRAPEGARMLGLITLEDVIEQLIKEDVYDETDSTRPSRSRSGSRSRTLSGFCPVQVAVGWKLARERSRTWHQET